MGLLGVAGPEAVRAPARHRTRLWGARIVVHADMDAFYAAVEQLDDPSLRGRPVLVGPKSNRGVVLTASYEARPYGVASAMPVGQALRRCPDAIVVGPRFDRYQEISSQVMEVLADFSPRVEALSMDEAFVDMTAAGQSLLNEFDDDGPFRLVGMAAFDLEERRGDRQLDLFEDHAARELETVVDDLMQRFGRGALMRARDLSDSANVAGDGVNLDYLEAREGTEARGR